MARLAAVCLLAAAACCLLRSLAFVPAPATRSDALTTATGAAVIATIPAGADAFVYKGKEYFDVFYGIEPLAWAFCGFCIVYYGAVLKNAFLQHVCMRGKEYFDVFYGIEPLAWAFCGFCIVYYGAVLKNAAQKYNIPPAPQPPKVGGFVGKEDLKPGNFLLISGRLKVIDFGIAKRISNDTTNIQRDTSVGTLSYMAPEAVKQGQLKLGRASDIWSLGIILYQMVYGTPPLAHLDPMQRLLRLNDPVLRIELLGHRWNSRPCRGNALHRAALENDLEGAQAALRKGSAALVKERFSYETEFRGQKQEGSGEAIHLAASRGNVELVKLLLAKNADLEAQVSRGELGQPPVSQAQAPLPASNY
ncbi:mph1 [Symbiodinium sp. CCMP2592]|nr:mph1 [Symbiodinium sp. CCMP2592]